mmetsp:Transcript_8305/g.20992  ORF Transcript_8305/g.20992 Transcript_8305/m.20992 type:complete len:296 (-) Transcript_8305:1279-2166(-)
MRTQIDTTQCMLNKCAKRFCFSLRRVHIVSLPRRRSGEQLLLLSLHTLHGNGSGDGEHVRAAGAPLGADVARLERRQQVVHDLAHQHEVLHLLRPDVLPQLRDDPLHLARVARKPGERHLPARLHRLLLDALDGDAPHDARPDGEEVHQRGHGRGPLQHQRIRREPLARLEQFVELLRMAPPQPQHRLALPVRQVQLLRDAVRLLEHALVLPGALRGHGGARGVALAVYPSGRVAHQAEHRHLTARVAVDEERVELLREAQRHPLHLVLGGGAHLRGARRQLIAPHGGDERGVLL